MVELASQVASGASSLGWGVDGVKAPTLEPPFEDGFAGMHFHGEEGSDLDFSKELNDLGRGSMAWAVSGSCAEYFQPCGYVQIYAQCMGIGSGCHFQNHGI